MTAARTFEVVVVGAGPAGAHVAGQFARRGRTVALVDRRPMDEAGAQWHNGVVAWQFAEAGVAPPVPDEITPGPGTGRMFGPDGTLACVLTDSPTVRADMGALGASLRAEAAEAGVTMIDRIGSITPHVDGSGRLRALDIELPTGSDPSTAGPDDGPAGEPVRFEADLFVDAAGHTGVLRRHSPALRRWCPPVRGDELCSATDAVLTIVDPDGARRFLADHGAVPGDSVSVLGYAGGWSTWALRPSEDLTRVAVLVGCVANGRYGTGPKLLAELRAEHAWLGEPTAVGTGVIPLRRPYARFTAPGLALVGDAACQVFPAHGSGIGSSLIAARMLADAAADANDPGDERVLWGYQHAFQRRFGGMFAALDAFRRMSTELGSDGVQRMVHAGMFDPDVARQVLDQKWGQPSLAALPRNIWGMATSPKLAKVMVPRLARGALLRGMGRRYPAEPDLDALARWDAKVERLLGSLPN